MQTEHNCESCKFYNNGWCELFMVEMPKDYKCRADYEQKEDNKG